MESSALLHLSFVLIYGFVIGMTEENAGSNLFHIIFKIILKNNLCSSPNFCSLFYFITLFLDFYLSESVNSVVISR